MIIDIATSTEVMMHISVVSTASGVQTSFLPSFCVEAMEYDSSYYHRSNQIHTIPTSLILISILLLLLHLTPPPPFIPSYHHRVASSALLLLMRVVASTTCDRYSCFLVTGLLFRIACRANNNCYE